jgi:hypothetical protein
MKVSRDSLIEELMEAYPGLVRFLIIEGLPCVVCGEPFWGTLGELAQEKGWTEDRIQQLVDKLAAEMAGGD